MKPKLTSLQQVFDEIWQYFVVEKHPQAIVEPDSPDKSRRCKYRTEEGYRCAIGCLMLGRVPEDDPIWDSPDGVGEIMLDQPDLFGPDINEDDLEYLQELHDHHLHDIESKLKRFACKNDLYCDSR